MAEKKPAQKRFTLDLSKVKRVQKILKAESEKDAIEQALDIIIGNDVIDRAHERFVRSKGEFVDVYGRMAK
jgi:hypothetical protein